MRTSLLKHGALALVSLAAAFGVAATGLLTPPPPPPPRGGQLTDSQSVPASQSVQSTLPTRADGEVASQKVGLVWDMSNADNVWTYVTTDQLTIPENKLDDNGNPILDKNGCPGISLGTDVITYKASKTFGDYTINRELRRSSKTYDDAWVGYDVVIPTGYTLNVNAINAGLYVDCDGYKWKVSIYDANGNLKHSSPERSLAKNVRFDSFSEKNVNVAGLAGKVTVKLQMQQSNTSKYLAIPELTIEVTLEKDSRQTYEIATSVIPEGAGIVTPDDGTPYPEGESALLTATPNWGYRFVKWTVDDSDVTSDENNSHTITNITAPHSAVATFEKYPWVSFAKPADVEGTVPATDYFAGNYKLPRPYFLMKNGYSFVGWTDGETTYLAGDSYSPTTDITLSAVFSENTVSLGDAETTVNWTFSPKSGPELNYEGKEANYVQAANINGKTIDVAMHINTLDNAGINGKRGKLNNIGRADNAQINPGTILEIPAVKGMTVVILAPAVTSAGAFTCNDENAILKDSNFTYTYDGDESTLKIISTADKQYVAGVTVTYPEIVVPTACTAPTAEVSAFNFEKKGYSITFTAANEGETLMVSKDGAEAVVMTSPATVWDVTTASAYAVAEGLLDSEVVEATVPAVKYEPEKPYIAWVYNPGYTQVREGYTKNALITALKEIGNVVLVEGDDAVAPNDDLKNADLIVCGEAMAGNKTFSNGMKKFVGVKPMINLKFFNYTSGRWSWGAPYNPDDKMNSSITPKNKNYKIFDGVEFNADGSIEMFAAEKAEKNHIQTVKLNDDLAGHTTLASIDIKVTTTDKKTEVSTTADMPNMTAMHCADKFLGIGLSCDDWEHYGSNAATIIKNAATMLLAGEPLDAVKEIELDVIHEKGTVKFGAVEEGKGHSFVVNGETKTFEGEELDVNDAAHGLAAGTIHKITPYINGVAGKPFHVLTAPTFEYTKMELDAETTAVLVTPVYDVENVKVYYAASADGMFSRSYADDDTYIPYDEDSAMNAMLIPNLTEQIHFVAEAAHPENTDTLLTSVLVPTKSYSEALNDIDTKVSEVLGEDLAGAKMYDLNGREVKGELVPGIYVVVKGQKAVKVVVR